MSDSTPSLEEWTRLYEAALRFKALAPWQWMYDSDLIGVQNPETGEVGYCCVMGYLGEHLALAVYPGPDGLESYRLLQSGVIGGDPGEILETQIALTASFEDREMLSPEDRNTIKQLGLKFRGRQAWPQFRSYRPGLQPWYLTGVETRFLTAALDQTVVVAERYRHDPDLLNEGPLGKILVRVPDPGPDGTFSWRDEWLDIPLQPEPEADAPLLLTAEDEERLEGLKSLPTTTGTLEIGHLVMPSTVKEPQDERPWFPQLILALDHRSGFVLGQEMVRREELGRGIRDLFLNTLVLLGELPKTIFVETDAAVQSLGPAAERLRIELSWQEALTAFEEVQTSLMAFFER